MNEQLQPGTEVLSPQETVFLLGAMGVYETTSEGGRPYWDPEAEYNQLVISV